MIRSVNQLPRFKASNAKQFEDCNDVVPTGNQDRQVGAPLLARFHAGQSKQPKAQVFCHERLRNLDLFKDRNPHFVSQLLEDVTVEIFHPGEIILHEGGSGDSMCCIA